MLPATRVKFFVSVHNAFSMTNVAFFTEFSVFNSSDPLYQETFDNGLLIISLASMTLSLSFTMVLGFPTISGLSNIKKDMA